MKKNGLKQQIFDILTVFYKKIGYANGEYVVFAIICVALL